MTQVPYGRYEEAYRAIHSALMGLTAAPPGHKLTKLGFSWAADGSLASLRGYEGDDLLFSLAFTWNPDGSISEVVRS
ncbi:MAG: hypothetical protein NWE93_00710 [Candidatus Bathyarchaeota archaeon]|nr:hypothetical protein [Candidatus Bathyarchaeota archaeon]